MLVLIKVRYFSSNMIWMFPDPPIPQPDKHASSASDHLQPLSCLKCFSASLAALPIHLVGGDRNGPTFC